MGIYRDIYIYMYMDVQGDVGIHSPQTPSLKSYWEG